MGTGKWKVNNVRKQNLNRRRDKKLFRPEIMKNSEESIMNGKGIDVKLRDEGKIPSERDGERKHHLEQWKEITKSRTRHSARHVFNYQQ